MSGTGSEQASPSILNVSILQKAVFLINSRFPLVTATCGCTIKIQTQATLLPKIQVQFAEFPKESSPATPELLQLAAPVLVLGTITKNRIELLFTGPEPQPNLLREAIHALYCFSL